MQATRVSIRKFREDDLQDLYALLSDPDVMKYLEPPFDEAKTARFLHEATLTEHPLIWAVENERAAFIGYVIFHPYDADSYEIGWVLAKVYWGQGYADELTRMMIQRAKGLTEKLVIECSPEQIITKKLALKHGFAFCERHGGCDVYALQLEGV